MAEIDRNSAEHKYDVLKKVFIKTVAPQINRIHSNSILAYVSGVISIVQNSNLENIKQSKESISKIEPSYKKFREQTIKHVDAQLVLSESEVLIAQQNYDLVVKNKAGKVLINEANNGLRRVKKLHDILSKRVKETKQFLILSDDVFKRTSDFINSKSGLQGKKDKNGNDTLTTIETLQKKKFKDKMKGIAKEGGMLGLSAIFGSALPAMIPDGIKAYKEFKKGNRENTKLGKAANWGSLGLTIAGGLMGSSAIMMAGSNLKQKANSELQKQRDMKDAMDTFNRSMFRKNDEFTYDNLTGNGKKTGKNESLDDFVARMQNIAPSKFLKRMHAKGSFITKGKTSLSPFGLPNDIAGEQGQETVRIAPLKNDPIAIEVRKTNSILQNLVDVNQEMLEDQEEQTRLAGLKHKEDKKSDSPLNNLFNKSKDKMQNKKDGLGVMDLIEGQLGADAIKAIVPKLLPLIGVGLAAGVATLAMKDALDAFRTGKSVSNDAARKVGLVKTDEDIKNGTDSRSTFGKYMSPTAIIDPLAEGAAKATSYVENFDSKKAISSIGNVFSRKNKTTTIPKKDGSIELRKGTRNFSNYNPGNIEYGDFAKKYGAVASDGRFAIFPNEQAGIKAMESLIFEGSGGKGGGGSDKGGINIPYKSKTLSQMLYTYAPKSENNVERYISQVKTNAKVDDKKMSEYTTDERGRILEAMKKHEGWYTKGNTSSVVASNNVPTVKSPSMNIALSPPSDGSTTASPTAKKATEGGKDYVKSNTLSGKFEGALLTAQEMDLTEKQAKNNRENAQAVVVNNNNTSTPAPVTTISLSTTDTAFPVLLGVAN